MSVTAGAPDSSAQTVHIRVQVIDLHSFTLDLQVPVYLPARDLTQRIARDAGLDAYWDDGRRRLYWLRARGRLLEGDETLEDLGVVNGELVYLLPEPPAGSGVVEQPPDYPENRGYSGKGTLALLGSLVVVLLWAVGWGGALLIARTNSTIMLPGLGLGFLCISFSRHLWGGQGNRARVAAVAVFVYLLVFVMVFLPSILNGESAALVYSESVGGFVTGLIGVFVGWLGWWGAVEPLPNGGVADQPTEQAAVAVVQCGICGLDVSPEVRAECPYACGRYFHTGCYQARLSVYRGDSRFCAVCNARVG